MVGSIFLSTVPDGRVVAQEVPGKPSQRLVNQIDNVLSDLKKGLTATNEDAVRQVGAELEGIRAQANYLLNTRNVPDANQLLQPLVAQFNTAAERFYTQLSPGADTTVFENAYSVDFAKLTATASNTGRNNEYYLTGESNALVNHLGWLTQDIDRIAQATDGATAGQLDSLKAQAQDLQQQARIIKAQGVQPGSIEALDQIAEQYKALGQSFEALGGAARHEYDFKTLDGPGYQHDGDSILSPDLPDILLTSSPDALTRKVAPTNPGTTASTGTGTATTGTANTGVGTGAGAGTTASTGTAAGTQSLRPLATRYQKVNEGEFVGGTIILGGGIEHLTSEVQYRASVRGAASDAATLEKLATLQEDFREVRKAAFSVGENPTAPTTVDEQKYVELVQRYNALANEFYDTLSASEKSGARAKELISYGTQVTVEQTGRVVLNNGLIVETVEVQGALATQSAAAARNVGDGQSPATVQSFSTAATQGSTTAAAASPSTTATQAASVSAANDLSIPEATSDPIEQIRADFYRNKAAIEAEGQDKLNGTDIESEAIRLLAKQTGGQIGNGALSLAGELEKAVLQLFKK